MSKVYFLTSPNFIKFIIKYSLFLPSNLIFAAEALRIRDMQSQDEILRKEMGLSDFDPILFDSKLRLGSVILPYFAPFSSRRDVLEYIRKTFSKSSVLDFEISSIEEYFSRDRVSSEIRIGTIVNTANVSRITTGLNISTKLPIGLDRIVISATKLSANLICVFFKLDLNDEAGETVAKIYKMIRLL